MVQRPGYDTVFELAADLAEDVPVSLEALRNRFVAEESAEEVVAGEKIAHEASG